MDFQALLPYIIGGLAGILIGAWITRMIFSIPKQLRLQEAQTQLLAKIAEKQGVPKNEIDVILRVAERP